MKGETTHEEENAKNDHRSSYGDTVSGHVCLIDNAEDTARERHRQRFNPGNDPKNPCRFLQK
jgi:hypothetical protein